MEQDSNTINPLIKELFTNLKGISDGFLESSHNDFELLTKMNDITAQKYAQSAEQIEKSNEVLAQVFEKLQLFQPHFEKIDKIEYSVANLENLVRSLDDYSKLLELRYRKL
ncbi:MAG: hypothetical protein EZS28_023139 [Streblomastix strix]|uniref:Biogenesis of lysosome-related organelles complex 1 subunit 2 n=1 Tax=Streblomastix strix TaxID=222440 RepID=A0A5J4VFX5_9EUKA|nr:MAG: hypothetical protein EZS28_023139 [Streblomastix strix]